MAGGRELGVRIQELAEGRLRESCSYSSSSSIWVFEPANVRTTNTYTPGPGIHTSTRPAKTFEDEDELCGAARAEFKDLSFVIPLRLPACA